MNAVNAVVLHERHVNAYADVHGITIYHISKASEKDSNYTYYRTLDFALQTVGMNFWMRMRGSGKHSRQVNK